MPLGEIGELAATARRASAEVQGAHRRPDRRSGGRSIACVPKIQRSPPAFTGRRSFTTVSYGEDRRSVRAARARSPLPSRNRRIHVDTAHRPHPQVGRDGGQSGCFPSSKCSSCSRTSCRRFSRSRCRWRCCWRSWSRSDACPPDSEIIALRASGFSLYRLLLPVGAFAIGAAVITFFLSVYARPWGNGLLRTGIYDIVKARASAGIKPKIFNDDFAGLVIYVDRIESRADQLYGILVSDQRGLRQEVDGCGRRRRGRTRRGRHRRRRQHGLREIRPDLPAAGRAVHHPAAVRRRDLQHRQPRRRLREHHLQTRWDINLDLSTALADLRSREKDVSELGFAELNRAIAEKRAAGEPSFAERVEWHRKIAIPIACLVFRRDRRFRSASSPPARSTRADSR